MSFRSGRPVRRYIIVLCILTLFVYFSGVHLGRNVPEEPVSSSSFGNEGAQIQYTRPETDYIDQQNVYLEIDRELIKKREREATRRQIDLKYCGHERCQFLLPIAITEQESKAQEHFRQLAFLAGKLGLTIVLPNVHSSHLGACRRFPFNFYYDHSWLEANKEFFDYITMEDFRDWISERQHEYGVPTSQEVYIDINENYHFLDKAKNCFKDQLDYSNWPTKRFTLEDPETFSKRVGNYTEILMKALQYDDQPGTPPDVISLFYDRRFGYIENPEVSVPLSYNQRWVKIADHIAKDLQPFVAIHWRMERLEPVSNMLPCAESLVRKVQEIAAGQKEELKLFLLTDYPHLLNTSKATPESMSFKLEELTQYHHDAIRYVYERLDVYLTTLQRENSPIPYDELPASHWNIIPVPPFARPPDMSVLGIVDKLVAMRAQYFLAGEPAVCGKQSSFTTRIKDERQRAIAAGDENIRMDMDTFSL